MVVPEVLGVVVAAASFAIGVLTAVEVAEDDMLVYMCE
jgi:hypothetical protein